MKLKFSIATYFIAYFFLLLLLYVYKIKTYFYWGNIAILQETFFDFSTYRFLTASFIFFLNLYFLQRTNKKKFAFIILSLFFILLTIPSLITFTSENMYPVSLMLFHQLLFFGLYFFSKIKVNFDRVPVLNKRQALLLFLILTTIGVIPYLLVYGPHINLKNLLLIDVYYTRTRMAALTNPYFGYTYSLFTRIVIPLLIVFALELRNKLVVLIGVFYLILFYLFGAHKTVYLGLIVVLIFYRWSYLKTIKKVLKYSNLFIILCIVLAFFSYDYPWILTFRRIHFLPALLDIAYLDFFAENYIYWSESILKSFVDYPYDLKHTYLIGQEYFKNPNMAANNGLISDGYMNFGTLGVLINIVIVSLYFMLLNSLNIPARYFGIYLLVVFSFLSSATFTVFLTHGGIALLLVSIFILNEKKSQQKGHPMV